MHEHAPSAPPSVSVGVLVIIVDIDMPESGSQRLEIDAPEPVSEFIDDFDDGHVRYADLVDDSDT